MHENFLPTPGTATVLPRDARIRPARPSDMFEPPFGWRLFWVLAALTVFRLAALYVSGTELFFDEAQYWSWSRDLAWGYYSKPPMIAWIIRAMTEVCGDGVSCIRAAAPLIHTATSFLVFVLARKLFDARFGFWSAVVFATLPGISLSSSLISTDAPLLFFWTAALLAFVKLLETRSYAWAAVLGLMLGLGLMAKYAMVYFALCCAVYLALAPRARWLLRNLRGMLAVAITGVVIAPNILWNLENGLATFSHTAANAKWNGPLIHPANALEFLGAQAGVFGPVLLAILVWCLWRAIRDGWNDPYRLLLSFSIPVIALITLQAFLSRAHANWAAVAYVSASILVAAVMVERTARPLYAASLLLHLGAMALIAAGGALAGQFVLPGGADPYARVLGWRQIAEAAGEKARQGGFKSIMADQRAITAELLYYLRNYDVPIVRWYVSGPPQDHFQLTRPISPQTPQPILLVTSRRMDARIKSRFERVELVGHQRFPAGPSRTRAISFFALDGYRGEQQQTQKR